jgi:hypothetical protein
VLPSIWCDRGYLGEQYEHGYRAAGPRGSIISVGQISLHNVISGRALLGGKWTVATSSNAWAPGGGPHCSVWSDGTPLALSFGFGSLQIEVG